MVTYKLALDERRAKQDGTFPLVVRVTYNRKVIAFQTGVYLLKKHWNAKSLQVSRTNENNADLNHKASNYYVKVQKAILTIERDGEFTLDALREMLTPKPIAPPKIITFQVFANDVIASFIKVKRTGNALVYQTAVNRLIKYCNNPNIKFSEINYTFLDNFRNKLLQEGMKKNTVGNYFRSIRALYNKAIKAKVVTRDLYPFHDISIKAEKTAKRAISIDDIVSIYNYPKQVNSQEWHAANYFFLSFALRGVSFTDMAYLRSKNIHKGYITYRRRKTQKIYTIKLHPVALHILDHYKDNPTGYLVPVFPKGIEEDTVNAKKITQQWIKTTNKYLCNIAKECGVEDHITTYVARHTWATTAKRLGYPNEMIAEAMGHEYGNKITNIYLDDFDQKMIDDMNDKILLRIIPCLLRVLNQYRYVFKPTMDKYKGQPLMIG